MEHPPGFLKSVLDSISENIVVIDAEGAIQYVNAPWCNLVNSTQAGIDWKGLNYLSECDKASVMGDELGTEAADGIRSVLNGRQPEFYLEYPCHSPDEKRWFMMRVTPLQWDQGDYFVLVHQDITERKLAEEKVNALARIDGLTGIANRRALDGFLHEECRRCMRLEKPVSLAMVDLDHFKLLNDTYGHQKGDDCLRQVASLLMETVNRPGDLCARYGGEEFILVWGDTPLEQAWELANQFLGRLADAGIPNRLSPSGEHLTASIGLAATIPASDADETGLITEADRMLYIAKQNGRNRIEPTRF